MFQVDIDTEKKEILRRYRQMLAAWRPAGEEKDVSLIKKAFRFALEAHKDMRRKTGEPYIYHPLEVARIVSAEIGLGEMSIVCALLHDVVEDTDYTLTDIEQMFGPEVARIIDGLTKITGIFDSNTDILTYSIQAENFKKMLLTLSDDVRVILIKMADRLHNMRTLDAMPPEKQLKIASETIYWFAPLAHRLGLYIIKSELEDLALKYTEPEIYQNIAEKIKESEKDRKRFINKFILPIKKALRDNGFRFEVEGRLKSIYSIWKKMKQKEVPFEEVYDLFAVRIIIDSDYETEKIDCWKVYTIVTSFYSPLHHRLRDWVSTPKPNGYESLHTTVMSCSGKWVEVQIRTRRMNEIAEKGYAAHWKYKNNSTSISGLDLWLNKITELLQSPEPNALDFVENFKLDLFSDEIYVFTPKGHLRTLPARATALDFAYHIHTELGFHCIGAKVNHRLVALSYELRNGDQVEIIASRKQKPKEEWLNFVVTAKARSNIKEAIKEEKKKYTDKGKQLLQEYFKHLHVEMTNSNVLRMQKYFALQSNIDLYFKVANNEIGLKEMKECCQENERSGWFGMITRPFSRARTPDLRNLAETIAEKVSSHPESLVIDSESEHIRHTISPCCNPIPGDDIVGFITTGNTIEVHRTNCSEAIQLMSKYGHRIVKAKWKSQESIGFLTGLKISGLDKKGLISEITGIISEKHNMNIRSFHLESHEGVVDCLIMLYVTNTTNLNELISQIKSVDHVNKVTRINRMDEKRRS
jgi:GTP pyrophosphokinase